MDQDYPRFLSVDYAAGGYNESRNEKNLDV